MFLDMDNILTDYPSLDRNAYTIHPLTLDKDWCKKKLTPAQETLLQSKLGKESDYRLAKEFNLSVTSIRNRRLRRGLPSYRNRKSPHKWTEEDISLLGTNFDRVIADRLGVPLHVVYLKRTNLGIPAYLFVS